MKKLLLAGLIAGLCSGTVSAADESDVAVQEDKGVRFNTAIGPFYDPIFDLAGSVIPTLAYEIGDAEKTSFTKLYGIYGTNGNYVVRAETNNFMGSNSEWYLTGTFNYSYAKLDVMDFMGMDPGPTVEVENVAIIAEGSAQYQIFDNAYFGPMVSYRTTEFERDSSANPFGTVNMITDKSIMEYGLAFTFDNRDNTQTPTNGWFVEMNLSNQEVENTEGATIPDAVPGLGGFTLNGDEEYYTVTTDIRTYLEINDDTIFAVRNKVIWNGDEAQDTLTALDKVAYGFTMEIAGRSAIGADFQLRHWLTDTWGVVGTVGLAKAIDANDEDLHYAVGGGVRYMLNPADKLSMRLDVTYSDQEEDEMLVFFNVSEAF